MRFDARPEQRRIRRIEDLLGLDEVESMPRAAARSYSDVCGKSASRPTAVSNASPTGVPSTVANGNVWTTASSASTYWYQPNTPCSTGSNPVVNVVIAAAVSEG